MIKILLIGGYSNSGKDVCAQFFKQRGYVHLAFADLLKRNVMRKYGLSETKVFTQYGKKELIGGTTVREILIKEAELARSLDPDVFAKKVRDEILESDEKRFIISDFRFQNEYDVLAREFNVVSVRIERKSVPVLDYASEHALDNFKFDYTVENDGSLDELEDKLNVFLD